LLLDGITRMKNIGIALLVLGAVIITQAITRYRAFFHFSPHPDSETAGFIAFRSMLTPLGWGFAVLALSGLCFYRARKRS
jgi:uncharacterized integral membrane protein